MLFVAREIRAPLDGRALRAVGCINSTTKFLFGVRAAHFPSPARLIARYNAAPVHFRRRRSVHPTTEASAGGERGGGAAAANAANAAALWESDASCSDNEQIEGRRRSCDLGSSLSSVLAKNRIASVVSGFH